MPHVIVKLYPGRSDEKKAELANEIVKNIVDFTGCEEKSVSVAIEDVEEKDWMTRVYDNDIVKNQENLVKKPGYGSLIERS